MLMEEVVSRANLLAAFNRVWPNGGAPGVDGLPVGDLWGYCQEHWTRMPRGCG